MKYSKDWFSISFIDEFTTYFIIFYILTRKERVSQQKYTFKIYWLNDRFSDKYYYITTMTSLPYVTLKNVSWFNTSSAEDKSSIYWYVLTFTHYCCKVWLDSKHAIVVESPALNLFLRILVFYITTILLERHWITWLLTSSQCINPTKSKFKLYPYSLGNAMKHTKTGILWTFLGEYGYNLNLFLVGNNYMSTSKER